MIVGVLLAAGAGRRFGGGKQLAPLGGRPLLQHAVDAACGAGELDRVVVVLGARAPEVRAGIEFGRAEAVACDGWVEGVAASLRCGVHAAGDADWVVVTLGDEPRLPSAAIDAVVRAAREAPDEVLAVRAEWNGRLGHPVALRRELLPRVASLRGDRGAREVLEGVPVVVLRTPQDLADVDTPDQLEALR